MTNDIDSCDVAARLKVTTRAQSANCWLNACRKARIFCNMRDFISIRYQYLELLIFIGNIVHQMNVILNKCEYMNLTVNLKH